MRRFRADKKQAKGWFFGPWNSEIPVPVGYANVGVSEAHYHEHMFEVYLVAQGSSIISVNGKELTLNQGDVLVVEPNEAHTFISCSEDYLHFVIHAPFVKDDKVLAQTKP